MKEKDYQNVLNYFNNNKKRAKIMTLLCKILPVISFICYGILIFILIRAAFYSALLRKNRAIRHYHSKKIG